MDDNGCIRFHLFSLCFGRGRYRPRLFYLLMAVSIDIPTSEPSEITAGDTWTWKKSLSDFLASDSWVLTYALVKDGKQIKLTASADGDDHLIEELPTDTAKHDPGIYHYQAYVTKGAERYLVGTGTIEVLPDFAQSVGYDGSGCNRGRYGRQGVTRSAVLFNRRPIFVAVFLGRVD